MNRRSGVVVVTILASFLVLPAALPTQCSIENADLLKTSSLAMGQGTAGEGEDEMGHGMAGIGTEAGDVQCPTGAWYQGQTMAGFSPGSDSFFDVFTLLGPPDMTMQTPMPLTGLIFCLDYFGCGLHFGVFDSDRNGQLSDQDIVRIIEGKAPYYGGNLQNANACVGSFFDVFVELIGPPGAGNVLPDPTDSTMQWVLYPAQGLYLVNEIGGDTSPIVRQIGVAAPNDTVFQDIHNWLSPSTP